MLVGVLDSFTGNIEILGLQLNPDELPAQLGAGYAGSTAAHEGVEDGFVLDGPSLNVV